MTSRGHSLSPQTSDSKPVVLHVMEALAGGTERHLVDLVAHIDGFQHVVAIPSSHQGLSTATAAERLKRAGALIEPVEMGRSRRPQTHITALAGLRRVIRRIEPDIIHGHSSVGGALARMATWSPAVPIVYTPHGLSRSGWATSVERLLGRRTDRLIAVSDSEREFITDRRVLPADRVIVIPNGIDANPPPPLSEPLRSRLGLGPDVPLVGSVGRLAWQKAPEIFVGACAVVGRTVTEAHFVLIGSGPLQKQVEQAVGRSGLDARFHLVPRLDDAAAAIAELDVFASASRFEGAPYTPLEAMRGGTAVVVTDVAGNKDVVQDGRNGLVVPGDNPHILADAILRLLQDESLRRQLVATAQASVRSYGVRDMAQATARVYQQLLA